MALQVWCGVTATVIVFFRRSRKVVLLTGDLKSIQHVFVENYSLFFSEREICHRLSILDNNGRACSLAVDGGEVRSRKIKI